MAHGGARPGAGRKPGSKNKKALNWNGTLLADPGAGTAPDTGAGGVDDIMSAAQCANLSPLGMLLKVMRNPSRDLAVRLEAAKAALPYAHARMAAPKDDQPTFFDGAGGDDWAGDLPTGSMRN